jgi:Ala-tRNA(Pro) deacylase
MIPDPIKNYLDDHAVPFRSSEHPYDVTAQRTAQAAHVSGTRFGKTIVIKQDGQYFLVVVPATESVDLAALRDLLGPGVALASELEMAALFPACEAGAMPPLGGLYGLPVIADACLQRQPTITVNGGTHTDVIELRWDDFVDSERPRILVH